MSEKGLNFKRRENKDPSTRLGNAERYTETKTVSRPMKTKDLSDQEKEFLDLILDGWHKTSASLKVFFPDSDWEDANVKMKARRKYNTLLDTKRAVQYLALNRNRATIFVPTDMDKVATHISDICFGNAIRKINKVSKNGEVIEIEETPSFSDQIAAAIFLKNYTEYKQKAPIVAQFEERKDEIDEKAKKFADMWKTRRIEHSPFAKERNVGSGSADILNEAINREVDRFEELEAK